MSSIHFAHSIEVPQAPAHVFAVLDDFSQTPKWLARCTGIEKQTPGPNAAGSKIRYSYKDGGRSGTMDGEIAARVPDQRFAMHYADKMMEVSVDFHMEPSGAGTRLTHTIDITPRGFFVRLFASMIRKQVPKQTVAAMESLRQLLVRG